MNIQHLGQFVKTINDARELSYLLDRVSDGLFKTDDSAMQSVLNEVPYELGMAINKIAAEEGVAMENKAGVQDFFVKLQDALNHIPVVTLTLAVNPKTDQVSLIHEWFYRTYHKIVLLDITVNPDILAGSIISVGGKYYDATLKKRMEAVST
jgi:hypothetical protein